MTLKRLPPALVKRFRDLASKKLKQNTQREVNRFFIRLPGIDRSRIEEAHLIQKTHFDKLVSQGMEPALAQEKAKRMAKKYVNRISKIREMDISKNYPEIGVVVLKRTEALDAKQKLSLIHKLINFHNTNHKPTYYSLKKPIAYPLGERYILMAKTEKPSLEEVLVGSTRRAKTFMDQLATEGANLDMLKQARIELERNIGYLPKDIFIIDFKEGKFVFMPYIEKPF
ncbi:MAG: hypothetical protein WC821_05250 [archaeon]|jgi:hypothetical protein